MSFRTNNYRIYHGSRGMEVLKNKHQKSISSATSDSARSDFVSSLIETLESDPAFAKDFYHSHEDLAVESFFVFAAKGARNAKELLKKCLDGCFECCLTFHRAKRAFIRRYTNLFGADMLPFMNKMRKWNADRQLAILKSTMSDVLVKDILAHPDTLMIPELDRVFVDKANIWQNRLLACASAAAPSPGAAVLLFHSNGGIRSWAMCNFKKSAYEHAKMDVEVINNCCRELSEVLKSFVGENTYNVTNDARLFTESLATALALAPLRKLTYDCTSKANSFQVALSEYLNHCSNNPTVANTCLTIFEPLILDMLLSQNATLAEATQVFLLVATGAESQIDALKHISILSFDSVIEALTGMALQPILLRHVMTVYSWFIAAKASDDSSVLWSQVWRWGDELLKTVYFSSKTTQTGWDAPMEKQAILTLFSNILTILEDEALNFVKSRQVLIQQKGTDLSLALLNLCITRGSVNDDLLDRVEKLLDKVSSTQKDRLKSWLDKHDGRVKNATILRNPWAFKADNQSLPRPDDKKPIKNIRPLPVGFSLGGSGAKFSVSSDKTTHKKPVGKGKLGQMMAELSGGASKWGAKLSGGSSNTSATAMNGRISPDIIEVSDDGSDKQENKGPKRTMKMVEDTQTGIKLRRVKGLDHSNDAKPLRTVQDLDRMILNFNTSRFSYKELVASLRELPVTFADAASYVAAFEPMLILECWEQYQQALNQETDGPSETFPCDVLSVSQVDDFTDIQFKRHGRLSPDEIVRLVSAESKVEVLGKVIERKRDKQAALVIVRIHCTTGSEHSKSLRPNSVWNCTRLFSLTTAYREYKALSRLPVYPLVNRILRPSPPVAAPPVQTRSLELQNTLHLNAPQSNAVNAGLQTREGFILVQGPPGTGKTTALLGLVGALPRPKKVLICTPSNAAADELTRRMMHGVYDTYGRLNQLRILRVGVTDALSADVQNVTLEWVVANAKKETGQQHMGEAERMGLERRHIDEAEIIISTLSFTGLEVTFHRELKFTDVIIDEACQAVETSTLIPMRYSTRRIFLFGDPNQLPATVLSVSAKEFSYSRSLFERMMEACPPYLLSIQYRMHPEISRIPSMLFYQGELKDAPDMADKCKATWHHDPVLPPYRFYDCQTGREQSTASNSKFNLAEAEACVKLVKRLFIAAPAESFRGRIGIISYYSSQLVKIKDFLRREFGPEALSHVAVGTVDSYQGQERDVIILSCVRAQSRGIGFVGDAKRINVSLTRAKKSLYVIGSANTLRQSDQMWRRLIEDSQSRHCFRSVSDIVIDRPCVPRW
ncbi:hypothetical protein SeMB42_g04397 [Synchytrium endobioticum]|uniref:AAA+ ATPase domain-containing protein n=1 Tax=Synchytrium endobioticum TaxID=286115 RepID=A0A507CYW9_9FUNG|nr:hypothetical protein SeMB42_g04397 [Synchytrium endobioticum]